MVRLRVEGGGVFSGLKEAGGRVVPGIGVHSRSFVVARVARAITFSSMVYLSLLLPRL